MTPQQGEALSNFGAAMMSRGSSYQPSYRPVAFYKTEMVSGMNKICFYNRLGSTEAMNVPITGICPLQIP